MTMEELKNSSMPGCITILWQTSSPVTCRIAWTHARREKGHIKIFPFFIETHGNLDCFAEIPDWDR